MPLITVERYHDFSYGHRVAGHESKCKYMHGHNGRVHFTCAGPQLDDLGRVIDFGVIKSTLCDWVEHYWDHKFLLWRDDPLKDSLLNIEVAAGEHLGYHVVPFNPTAENMASYLLTNIGPYRLKSTKIQLVKVRLEETRKCGATVELAVAERMYS